MLLRQLSSITLASQSKKSGAIFGLNPVALAASAAIVALAVPTPTVSADILTNIFTASAANPYSTTDLTGQSVTFTSLAIANLGSSPSIPNGPFTSLAGTATGTFTTNGTVLSNGVTTADSGSNVYPAFQYDNNGFRLIGKYTTSGSGTYSQPNVKAVSPNGQVLGGEGRSDPNSGTTGILGSEVWLSTPTAPGAATSTDVYLGLFSGSNVYTAVTNGNAFPPTTGTYSQQAAQALAGGYAVGTSGRFAGNTNPAIGQVYSQTNFHGTITNNLVTAGTSIGTSAWIETSAGVPTEIGLMGSGNSYSYSTPASLNGGTSTPIGTLYTNGVAGVNAAGTAFGTSSAFDPAGVALGQDGWIYNGTTTTAIGLYTTGQTVTIPGYGTGAASTFNYYSTPTTTGTTPNTTQYRSTSVSFINPSGIVTGYSSYYPVGATSTSATGQTAWTYNGTSYTPLGFTTNNFPSSAYPLPVGVQSYVNGGPSYVGQTASNISQINAKGTTAGFSTFYVGQGTSSTGTNNQYTQTGTAAWSATPAGALTRIGLYNQGPTAVITQAAGTANAGYSATYDVHQNPTTYGTSADTPVYLNSNGLIAGTALRYSTTGAALGADVWVYDPTAGVGGTTYPVDPTDENGTGYVQENVSYLSDTGIVVGQIKFASAFATPYSTFIWNDAAPTTSFKILNGTDISNLSSAGFQNLINSYYADPTGFTYETAGNTVSGTANTVNGLVTVVPEPASLGVIALGMCGLARRRRRTL